MALFVLGDPHLSLGASKPMDIFPGWNDYVERLEKNWRKLIKPEDTIVLAGDISWAMHGKKGQLYTEVFDRTGVSSHFTKAGKTPHKNKKVEM